MHFCFCIISARILAIFFQKRRHIWWNLQSMCWAIPSPFLSPPLSLSPILSLPSATGLSPYLSLSLPLSPSTFPSLSISPSPSLPLPLITDCSVKSCHCNTLLHTATHHNTQQHTATHYNNPKHTAVHGKTPWRQTAQRIGHARCECPKEGFPWSWPRK